MIQTAKILNIFFSENLIPETPIRGGEEPENVFSPSSMAQTTAWHNQHRMIYVRKGKGSVCHWPIPESFWPDPASTRIVSGHNGVIKVCFKSMWTVFSASIETDLMGNIKY